MKLEERLRDAYEQLPAPGLDGLDAFDRFRRRRTRRTAVTGGLGVLVVAAAVVLTLAGVRAWSGSGGSQLGPLAPAPSSLPPATSHTIPATGAVPDLPSLGIDIRPLGPARAVADAASAGRRWILVVQRGRYLDRPQFGPVTCMAVLPAPRVPRYAFEGGGCQPESHPGSEPFDLGTTYGPASADRMANGLAGSVPPSAVRVRVRGRCGWEPTETEAMAAGPEFPARFFLVAPQPKGQPDVVLAVDADGHQVSRQVLLDPGTDCQGRPTNP
jgi:hypothetical protein